MFDVYFIIGIICYGWAWYVAIQTHFNNEKDGVHVMLMAMLGTLVILLWPAWVVYRFARRHVKS